MQLQLPGPGVGDGVGHEQGVSVLEMRKVLELRQ